ncbi:MAG: polysaccharide biosynthesis/export family protein [Flavobacteriaceae bacterium]|nr:polysaccharide biosynthesis/export family protein [Flavobacteriaceae bacterium]
MFKQFLLLIALVFLASCVPNKDLVYLQGKPLPKNEVYKLNNQPYRLQVDDVIHIDIKAKDTMTKKVIALFLKDDLTQLQTNTTGGFENNARYEYGYNVDKHGNIRLPYLGEMNVLGFTTKEVRIKLEKALLEYLKNENDIFVTVTLSGIKYTIMGEVVAPGPKVIYQNKVTIFDAISNAGDILLTGNKKNVELWRKSVQGRKKYTIDLTKATAFDSDIFYIQPNDIINVKALRQKSWGTGTTGLQSLTTIISVFSLVTSTILLIKNL